MASTTPTMSTDRQGSRQRSTSRGRNPPSRPTTPLRPISRASLHDSGHRASGKDSVTPLDALEPAFAELSDSMADLEANFMHLQLMHESLARFSENFAAFLFGMNMNAFCVDFPEAPIPESFKRAQQADQEQESQSRQAVQEPEIEATFLTTDSFVENPPSSKAHSKFSTPAPPTRESKIGRVGSTRGGSAAGRGGRGSSRGSGLARASARGRGRGG